MHICKSIAALALIATPLASARAQTLAPSTYVMKAGAGDLYEVQSSKLLLTSTSNAGLKKFAQMMVTDHGKSTAEVKAAVAQSKLTAAPPKLNAEQSGNMAALRAAKGTARDRLYVQQQKTAHQQALALHQDYAANGTAPALKATAGKIVPVVQHHIAMLGAM